MLPTSVRILVCTERQDMRRSFDTLAAVVRDVMSAQPTVIVERVLKMSGVTQRGRPGAIRGRSCRLRPGGEGGSGRTLLDVGALLATALCLEDLHHGDDTAVGTVVIDPHQALAHLRELEGAEAPRPQQCASRWCGCHGRRSRPEDRS